MNLIKSLIIHVTSLTSFRILFFIVKKLLASASYEPKSSTRYYEWIRGLPQAQVQEDNYQIHTLPGTTTIHV